MENKVLHSNAKSRFFTNEQIACAFSCSRKSLLRQYEKSEWELQEAAKIGDENVLAKVMEKHRLVEYALLYQLTPEFKKRSKR